MPDEIQIEQAMARMDGETARDVWDRQHDDDADPIQVEAASRKLTAAGWE